MVRLLTDSEIPAHTENLAQYAHEAWAGWMRYMLSKMELNEDGSATMPAEFRARWWRQVITPYVQLPESEKESDRVEARKMLAIIGLTTGLSVEDYDDGTV